VFKMFSKFRKTLHSFRKFSKRLLAHYPRRGSGISDSQRPLLISPLIFTLAVCGGSFLLADLAIKYKPVSLFKTKSEAPVVLKSITSNVDSNQLTLNCLIGANALVFFGFNFLPDFFHKHFATSAFSGRVYPLLTSMFAHQNLWHFLFNMFTLYSFAPIVQNYLGNEYFLSFYVTSGMVANLSSHYFHALTSRFGASIGASGAILGVLGMCSSLIPNASVLLFFVIPISMKVTPLCIVAFDLIGLTGLWSRIFGFTLDHAAHLGGLGFGLTAMSTIYSPRQVYYWKNPHISLTDKLKEGFKLKQYKRTQ